MDLDSIRGKLYGVLPENFISARSAEVRGAKSAGDRQLAAAVGQLRRPTIGAWLANQLARERQDDLEALLDLGGSMRKAQGAADGPELRRLAGQRRQMIDGLVAEAKGLAHTRQQPLSQNSTRELENTLEAAVATAEAADAVRAGCLHVGLTYSGFGSLDVGTFVPDLPEKQKTPPRTTPAVKERPRPQESKKRRVELAEAERKAKSAEEAVRKAQQVVKEVQAERDALEGEIVEAERHLREARKSREGAEHRLVEAKRAEKDAKREAVRADNQRKKTASLLEQTLSSERSGS